jgi:MFS family permease
LQRNAGLSKARTFFVNWNHYYFVMATQTAIELQSTLQYQPALEPSTQVVDPFGGWTNNSRPLSLIQEAQTPTPKLSKSRSWVILVQLCGINFIASFSTGLLTIGLPAIAFSLKLSDSLLLWPTSVFSLTGGSCLLIAGSITDVFGPRRVNLLGSFFIATFILVCGLAHDGIEIILFRAFEGIATALFVPSAVSIVSTNMKHGRPRNIGFALIFLAYPLGYGLGLALGGVFVNTVGWRVGFFADGATGFLLFLIGLRTLPKDTKLDNDTVKRLRTEIDWIGALIASACLSTFSYVLA